MKNTKEEGSTDENGTDERRETRQAKRAWGCEYNERGEEREKKRNDAKGERTMKGKRTEARTELPVDPRPRILLETSGGSELVLVGSRVS